MSYYESQTSWQNQPNRSNWDQRASGSTPVQAHFPRSHASDPSDLTVRYTASMKPEDPSAFGSQLDGDYLSRVTKTSPIDYGANPNLRG